MGNDLELMLRVRSGDAESFDELVRRHRSPLLNYFHRMVQDRALAEDLAQEVFLRVYKSRERYQPEAKFTTWLYRIATNVGLNAIRDRKAENLESEPGSDNEDERPTREFVDPQPTVEHRMMQQERELTIRQAIAGLPENQRVAVILHKYQEVEYRQIAAILKVSESAVKSLLFRAYESLRVRLEPALKEGQR